MYLDREADIIADYIKDPRYKQAVLINGAWGAGKTYFVEEKLIKNLSGYIIIRAHLKTPSKQEHKRHGTKKAIFIPKRSKYRLK